MNILKRLAWICVMVSLLSSCKNQAVDFNNNLVNIQKNVLKEVQDFGKKMKEHSDTLQTDDIKTQSDQIVLFISDQIKKAAGHERAKRWRKPEGRYFKPVAI